MNGLSGPMVTIVGLLLIGGCASPPQSANTISGNRCAQSQSAAKSAFAAAQAIADGLRPSNFDGDTSGVKILGAHASYPSDRDIQRQGRMQLRVAFRTAIDNPTCFTPQEVALAQEGLVNWAEPTGQ